MKKKSEKNYVLILASGGIDSTACIQFYKNLDYEIDLLFVDYNHPSKEKETETVKRIAKYYSLQLQKIEIKNLNQISEGFVTGRNAFLLFCALLNFNRASGLIALGIHAGTVYFDCSPEFLNSSKLLFEKYSNGSIKPVAPFLQFSKMDIYNYCILEKVPIHLTYSCELGKDQPCGICNTCLDLVQLYDSKK